MSTVDSIVQACVVLHYWFRDAQLNMLPGKRRYMPVVLTDYENRHGSVQDGHWRLEEDCNQEFRDLAGSSKRNSST